MLLQTFLLAALAATPTAPRLATVDWVVTRADPALGPFYADALARALRAQGLEVVTPQELGVLIGQERQRALLGCDADTSCLAELVNAVGCSGTVVVNLARLDSTLTANIKVLSATTGKALAEVQAEAQSETAFLARLDSAAAEIADRMMPGRARARSRARVPLVAGAVVTGLGAAAVGFAWYERAQVVAELERAHVVTGAASQAAAVGRVSEIAGWAALGVGVAGLALGAAWMASVGSGEPAAVALVPVPGGAVVSVGGGF